MHCDAWKPVSVGKKIDLDFPVTICELFSEQTQIVAGKFAIIQDDRSLDYQGLARLAATIAQDLSDKGVVRGDIVGILASRSIETVAAQLGIMALGAAFVPLDPVAPVTYLKTIIGAVAPKAIVFQECLKGKSAELDLAEGVAQVLPLIGRDDAPDYESFQQDPRFCIGAEDRAYVIYTSGSTGDPKGVMVAHRGICRLVRGQTYVDLGQDQVVLNLASVGFDVILSEIYSALLNGGTLVVVPEAAPSIDRIGQIISREWVKTAYITAGLFHIIAEQNPAILGPLDTVIPCGDVLSSRHVAAVREMFPHLRILNGCGPTEATVFTCFYEIPDDWDGGAIPIGRGLNGDQRHVLDDDLRPVPQGTLGQLAVGGLGTALGYYGRPDLTEKAFVTLPDDPSGRVYLTGDLVRERADGVFEFNGRADRQIKINGQRIELDAVEHAMRKDDGIEDAVAVARPRPTGGKQIVAFAIATPNCDDTPDAILNRLRVILPEAAMPSRLLLRDAFPLSRSGKVDRKQLAQELELAEVAKSSAPIPMPTTLAGTIHATWAEVLGTDIANDQRPFFELGGTSLQLIEVHALLQKRLDRSFDIARLFEAPRVQQLAQLLDAPEQATGDALAARRVAMARNTARQRRAG